MKTITLTGTEYLNFLNFLDSKNDSSIEISTEELEKFKEIMFLIYDKKENTDIKLIPSEHLENLGTNPLSI